MCMHSRYRSTRFLFISHLYLINVENRFIDYTRLLKVMKLIQEGFIFYKITILHEHRIATHGMMVYLIPRCCFLLKSTWHGHELLSSDSAPQQVSSNTPRRKGFKQGLIKKIDNYTSLQNDITKQLFCFKLTWLKRSFLCVCLSFPNKTMGH